MKAPLWTTLAISLFATLGNGQDGAVPPPPPNGYGIQGNVSWTQAQREADLEKAALAARQKKAVMDSMASASLQPPTITTAEQFLAVHRPPPLPPGETSNTPSPVRRDTYVPQFENAPSQSGRGRGEAPVSSTPSFSPDLPAKKSGLFGFFKSKDKGDSSGESGPTPNSTPASAYPETPMNMESNPASAPPLPPAPAAAPGNTARSEATMEIVSEGSVPSDKPSLFGRLFGKDKAAQLSSVPDPILSPAAPPSAPTTPALPVESVGIPEPPSLSGAASAPSPPPAPASAPAESGEATSSIFVKRASSETAGTAATVLTTTQATVDGVLVKLYEGATVSVLERSGSMARVRLPDQREGTVAASALGR